MAAALEGASDSCPELALPELAAEAFLLHIQTQGIDRKEKKRKDYAFWRQFHERPSIILGCPVLTCSLLIQTHGDGFYNVCGHATISVGTPYM